MDVRAEVLITILGMAAVTYFTRVSGVWLVGRFKITGRVETWLQQIPGAVLVSLVAPSLVTSGLAPIPGAVVTVLVFKRTNNVLLAMIAGVVTVWLIRTIAGQS